MNSNLYMILNIGCDDTTKGLAEISDEDFPKFEAIIRDLNKNSLYGCMPVISVYKVNKDAIKEISLDPKVDVDRSDVMHLKGKTYTFTDETEWIYQFMPSCECIIDGTERN